MNNEVAKKDFFFAVKKFRILESNSEWDCELGSFCSVDMHVDEDDCALQD